MKCHKIRRLLPLMAGSELPESQAPMVKSHLEGCPRCREEYETYVFLIGRTRKWFAEDRIGWKDEEWEQTVRSVVNQASAKKKSLVPWPFPKAWAYAVMAGVMLLATTLIVRPPFVEQFGLAPRSGSEVRMEKQEVISMTMVSKETGLKIVWILNKNFNLEENE